MQIKIDGLIFLDENISKKEVYDVLIKAFSQCQVTDPFLIEEIITELEERLFEEEKLIKALEEILVNYELVNVLYYLKKETSFFQSAPLIGSIKKIIREYFSLTDNENDIVTAQIIFQLEKLNYDEKNILESLIINLVQQEIKNGILENYIPPIDPLLKELSLIDKFKYFVHIAQGGINHNIVKVNLNLNKFNNNLTTPSFFLNFEISFNQFIINDFIPEIQNILKNQTKKLHLFINMIEREVIAKTMNKKQLKHYLEQVHKALEEALEKYSESITIRK